MKALILEKMSLLKDDVGIVTRLEGVVSIKDGPQLKLLDELRLGVEIETQENSSIAIQFKNQAPIYLGSQQTLLLSESLFVLHDSLDSPSLINLLPGDELPLIARGKGGEGESEAKDLPENCEDQKSIVDGEFAAASQQGAEDEACVDVEASIQNSIGNNVRFDFNNEHVFPSVGDNLINSTDDDEPLEEEYRSVFVPYSPSSPYVEMASAPSLMFFQNSNADGYINYDECGGRLSLHVMLPGDARVGAVVHVAGVKKTIVKADMDLGFVEVELNVPQGNVSVAATITNPGAMVGPASAAASIIFDTVAPMLSVSTMVENSAPMMMVQGKGEAGSRIEIRNDSGELLGKTIVDAQGDWSAQIPSLPAGTMIHLDAMDAAGNQSAMASRLLASTGPTEGISSVISVTISAITEDTGAADFVTQDGSLLVSGRIGKTLAQGERLEISSDNGITWAQVDVVGLTWSFDDSAVSRADGSFEYRVRVITDDDLVLASDTQIVTVDSVSPQVDGTSYFVVIEDGGDGQLSPDESSAVVITAKIPAEDNLESIEVINDGKSYFIDAADISIVDGLISINPQNFSDLLDGNITVILTVVDRAGNVGRLTDSTIKVAATEPPINPTPEVSVNAISIESITEDTATVGDFITQDKQLLVSGSLTSALADGERLEFSDDGLSWSSVSVNGTAWEYDNTSHTHDDGVLSYRLRIVDGLDRVVTQVNQRVEIDTEGPGTNPLNVNHQITIEDGGDGFINRQEVQAVALSGKIESGDSIEKIIISNGSLSVEVDPADISVDGDYRVSVAPQNLSVFGNTLVTVTMTVADAAGNNGELTDSSTIDVQVTGGGGTGDGIGLIEITAISEDRGAPADFITNDKQLIVSGTLSSTLALDEVVELSRDGGATWGNADVSGLTWTFDDQGFTHADGDVTYLARIIDGAGNVGAKNEKQVTIDTEAPSSAGQSIRFEDGGDGFLNSKEISSVSFTGNIEPADRPVVLRISDGVSEIEVVLSDANVDGNGVVTINNVDLSTLIDGELTAVLTVRDIAGNTGTVEDISKKDTRVGGDGGDNSNGNNGSLTISIDAISEDRGESSNDFITSDTSLIVTGTLSDELKGDERVELSYDNGNNWHEVVTTGTQWEYDKQAVNHLDGEFNYQVRVIDEAANVGASDEQLIVIDSSAPGVLPGIHSVQFNDGGDGRLNQQETSAVAFSGKIEPGDSIVSFTIIDSSSARVEVGLSDVSVDSGGNVTVTPQNLTGLSDGTLTVVMVVQDLAGNEGSVTNNSAKDTEVDLSNIITFVSIGDDSGIVGDFITNDKSLIVSGVLVAPLGAGERLEISSDQGSTWQEANVLGTSWVFDNTSVDLPEGKTNFLARIIDDADNIGATNQQLITIDQSAPIDGLTHNIKFLDGDGFLSLAEIEKVALIGQVDSDDQVTKIIISDGVSDIEIAASDFNVDANGLVTVFPQNLSSLADGELTVRMTVIDTAGNPGVVVDQSVKDTEVGVGGNIIAIDSISDDTGTVGDFVTRDTGLIISGSISRPLALDERIEVSADGGVTWSSVLPSNIGSATWSFDNNAKPHVDGSFVYVARIIDLAGNIGSSDEQTVTIDTQSPGGPGGSGKQYISFLDGGDEFLNSFEIPAVRLEGKIEATDSVVSIVISDGSNAHEVNLADINVELGVITVQPQDLSLLDDGLLTVTLNLKDNADNPGSVSDTSTKDTLIDPAAGQSIDIVSIDNDSAISNDFSTTDRTLIVYGTLAFELAAGERVEFSDDDGLSWSQAQVNGINWNYDNTATSHDDGQYVYQVRVTDDAGNIGVNDSQLINVSNSVPGGGQYSILINDGGDGYLNSEEVLSVIITAKINPSDTIVGLTISDGVNDYSVPRAQIREDNNGNISVELQNLSGLADGVITATLQLESETGVAGSISDTSIKDTSVGKEPDNIVDITAVSIDSNIDGDFITNDSSLIVSGTIIKTLAPDERVELSRDDGLTWLTATTTGTVFSLDDQAFSHADGTVVYKVRIIDNAGNVGAEDSQSITIDSTAPGTGSIIDPAHSIQWLDGGDGYLNGSEVSKVTLKGKVDVGDSVDSITISDGVKTETVLNVTVDGNGVVTAADLDLSSFAEGELVATMQISDTAGNVGSVADTTIKDTLTGPVGVEENLISILQISDDTGVAGDFVTNDTRLIAQGNVKLALQTDERIEFSDDGVNWRAVDMIDATQWRFDNSAVSHPDGVVEYSVRIIDKAGNVGKTSTQSIVIDTQSPGTGVDGRHSILINDGGDGYLNQQEINKVTLTGKIDPTDTINELIISDGNNSITINAGDINILSNGVLSINAQDLASLDEGELTARLIITDSAGNTGEVSDSSIKDTQTGTLGVDNTIQINAITNDTGAASDFITSDKSLLFTGRVSEPLIGDERVEVSFDAGLTWAEAAVVGLDWSFDNTGQEFPDGTVNVRARIIDAAGNIDESTQQDIIIDTSAPGATPGDHTIIINDGLDGLLNAQEIVSVSLSGKITQGDRIEKLVISDGVSELEINLGTDVSIDGNNIITVVPQDLSGFKDGPLVATLTIVDVAGNSGQVLDQSIKDTEVSGGGGSNSSTKIFIDSITDDTGTAGDFITNDASLVIAGRISAALLGDETLEISDNGGTTWHAVSLTGTDWNYDNTANDYPDGEVNFQLRVIDTAGNVGATADKVVTIDGKAPGGLGSIHRINFVDDNGVLNKEESNSVLFEGLVEKSDEVTRVEVSDGNTSLIIPLANVGLNAGVVAISAQDLSALNDGELTVVLTIKDSAGNIGTVSNTIDKDTEVSGAGGSTTTVDIISISEDSAAVGDFITSDNSLLVNGTLSAELEADEHLEFSSDEGVTWTKFSVTGQNWSFDNQAQIHTDGKVNYRVRIADAAGNIGAGDEQEISIDTRSPGGSSVNHSITINDGGDGQLNAQEITVVTLSGKIEFDQGDQVESIVVSDGNLSIELSGITVDSSGNVSVQAQNLSALSDGVLTAVMTIVDAAGNSGTVQDDVKKDTTIGDPSSTQVVMGIDAISEDSGIDGDFITNDSTLIVSGSIDKPLEDGEYIEISFDNGSNWQKVSQNGLSWEFDNTSVSHPDGSLVYSVRIADLAGNAGASVEKTVLIDSSGPGSQIGDVHVIAFDDGGDGLLGNTEISTVSFTGKIEVGDTISKVIVSDGVSQILIEETDITVNGSDVTISAQNLTALLDGDLTVTMTVVDVAGNSADISNSSEKDTQAGVGNVVSISAVSADSGIPTDFLTNDNTLLVTGGLSLGLKSDEYLELSSDAGATWSRAAVAGLSWTFDDTATSHPDGVVIYEARIADEAGNVGGIVSKTVTIDTQSPGTGVDNNGVALHSILIVDGADGILNAEEIKAVVASGKVEDGDRVESIVFGDGSSTLTVNSSSITVVAGVVSVSGQDLSALSDGPISVVMNIVDPAGNTGDVNDTSNKNTQSPPPPVLVAVNDDQAPAIGNLNNNGVTDDARPFYSGTAESNVKVNIFDNGILIKVVQADGSGAWTYQVEADLNLGAHSITLSATNAVGNVSDTTSPFNFDYLTDPFVSTNEDESVNLSKVNFGIGSEDGSVSIRSLPADGLLLWSNDGSTWQPVTVGYSFTTNDLQAGNVIIQFVPDANEFGSDELLNPGVGPGFNDYANFDFDFDNGSGAQSYSMVVDVRAVNDAPIAVDDLIPIAHVNLPLDISTQLLLANDSDIEGDDLSVINVSGGDAGKGTINLLGDNLIFTPVNNFTGIFSFDYTVSDGNGGTRQAVANLIMEGPVEFDIEGVEAGGVLLGADNDIVRVRGATIENVINGGGGIDTIYLNMAASAWEKNIADVQSKVINFEVIRFSDGEVLLLNDKNGSSTADVIDTAAGNDFIVVEQSNLSEIRTGAGNDTLRIKGMAFANMDMSSGNNSVTIDQDLRATLLTGADNDSVIITGNADLNSIIQLGGGENSLSIGGDSAANISTGGGKDTISIGGNLLNAIVTGEGGDSLVIEGDSRATINVGAGDDSVTVNGDLSGAILAGIGNDTITIGGVVGALIDGGTGINVLSLDINRAQWDADYLSIQSNVSNFQLIKFNDGSELNIDTNEHTGVDDVLVISGDQTDGIDTGSGSDNILISGNSLANINLGEGNNKLDVSLSSSGVITAGSGNDVIKVGVDLGGAMSLGGGNDSVDVQGDVTAALNTGAGDDNLTVFGDVTAAVSLLEGDDTVKIDGNVSALIDGGSGSNTIELNISVSDWTSDVGGIQSYIQNFDTIRFNDGNVLLADNSKLVYSDLTAHSNLNFGVENDQVSIASSTGLIALGAGDNELIATGSLSNVSAGNGNDDITADLIGYSGAGDVGINLGNGNNSITVERDFNAGNFISGDGNDFISVKARFGASSSSLSSVDTGDGDDEIIVGNQGLATMNLGGGNDSYTLNKGGHRGEIRAGTGDDRIEILAGSISSFVDLGAGDDLLSVSGSVREVVLGSGHNTMTATSSLSITGLGGDDDVRMTGTATTVDLGAGDNILHLSGATDINFGDGDDELQATATITTLDLGDGDNTVNSTARVDTVTAGSGNDDIAILNSNEIVALGDGNNVLVVNGFLTGLTAGDGDDQVQAGLFRAPSLGDVGLSLGDGNNTLNVDQYIYSKNVTAGSGNDSITVGAALGISYLDLTSVVTGKGNDSITVGNVANANIDLGEGDDQYVLTKGNHTGVITAGAGDDIVEIKSGGLVSKVEMGSGDDKLFVSSYANDVDLGSGDNVMTASWARDIDSADGNDDVRISGVVRNVNLGDGDNILELGETNSVILGDGNDSLLASGVIETVDIGGGENTINSAFSIKDITAGDGRDDISIAKSIGVILLGEGDNTLTSTGILASVKAGAGDDTIRAKSISFSSSGQIGIDLGDGDNRLTVDDGLLAQNLTTGSGNDIISIGRQLGSSFADPITADTGAGNDVVSVGHYINGSLNLGDGDDILTWGSTYVVGTLDGGAGVDTISLQSVSLAQWESGPENILNRFTGFEFVELNDSSLVVAPTAIISITAISDDTSTPDDFITSDSSLTLSGSLSAALIKGHSLEISNDDGASWEQATVVVGSGFMDVSWSLEDLDDHTSDFTYTARVVDANGDIVGAAVSQDITIASDPIVAPLKKQDLEMSTDEGGVESESIEGLAPDFDNFEFNSLELLFGAGPDDLLFPIIEQGDVESRAQAHNGHSYNAPSSLNAAPVSGSNREEVLLFNDILSDHDETIDGLFFDQQRSSVDNISSVDSFGSGALLPDNVLSNSMPTVTALTAGASPEFEELEQMRQGFSDHSVFY